jgi:hypothetical protein|tara:strand:- start:103 stop:549 length:447 start_codon:yes stop_codon:yes gene_type:complete
MKKTCVTCQRELLQEEYTGKRNVCRRCTSFQRNAARNHSPESYLAVVFSKLKNARKDMEWELDMDNIKNIWRKQNGKCALSGVFMTWHGGEGKQDFNVSIDRKDPNKGYIIGNVQLVTQRVNTMKHTLGESEFYWWCKNITHNKENAD